MTDSYVYVITALLPLAALMLVLQRNPYHALIIRGVLGAVAALVYTVLGAADVALTEALVGTLLAITLYAVAVRSSMVLRLGVLKDDLLLDEIVALQALAGTTDSTQGCQFNQIMDALQQIFGKRYMRVERVSYLNRQDLHQALLDKDVHAICAQSESRKPQPGMSSQFSPYDITTRLRHLYDILQTELAPSLTHLTVNLTDSQEALP